MKLATLLIEKMVPGDVVPTPKLPFDVNRPTSLRTLLFCVEKVKSPLPVKLFINMEVIAAVLVAKPYASSVRRSSVVAVVVADAAFIRMRLVVVAAEFAYEEVAPPRMVRPALAVLPPIVVEANAVNPPLNCTRVLVALKKLAWLNGYARPRDEEDTLLLKRDQSVDARQPLVPEPAVEQSRVVPLKARPLPMATLFTGEVPLPARMPPRVVDPVPPKLTATDVVPLVTPVLLVKRMELVMFGSVRPPESVVRPVLVEEACERKPPWRNEKPVVVAPPLMVRPPS